MNPVIYSPWRQLALLTVATLCQPAMSGQCLNGCSGHGECDSKTEQCLCQNFWSGHDCSFSLSSDEDATSGLVAGHAEANFVHPERPAAVSLMSAACLGGSGPACGDTARSCAGCGENGSCVGGNCLCKAGFFGPSCNDRLCANDCWGHGTCSSGACLCHQGWAGVQCQLAESGAAALVPSRTFLAARPKTSGQNEVGLMQQSSSMKRTAEGLFDVAKFAAQVAGEAAKKLGDAAKSQSKRDAAERMHRALERARENAGILPGHQFASGRLSSVHEETKRLSLLDVGSSTTTPPAEIAVSSQDLAVSVACGTNCTGHGTCDVAAMKCNCDSGWMGAHCDTKPCKDDCSGSGMCVSGRCLCDSLYFGDSCQNKRCPSDCSGNGYCFSGRCQCTGDFGGEDCSQLSHNKGMVKIKLPKRHPMLKGRATQKVSSLRTADAGGCDGGCGGHGECDTYRRTCTCSDGFSGPNCQEFCPNACSHQGDCVKGFCLCLAGFHGDDCSQQGCCNGRGSCAGQDGSCTCDAGWGGEFCTVELLCADENCSGHGVCSHGNCLCSIGYSGPACETAAPTNATGLAQVTHQASKTSTSDKDKGNDAKEQRNDGLSQKGWARASASGAEKESMLQTSAGEVAQGSQMALLQCGEHGQYNIVSRRCECKDGFSGAACHLSCKNGCSGHGTCQEGNVCLCETLYSTEDCSVWGDPVALLATAESRVQEIIQSDTATAVKEELNSSSGLAAATNQSVNSTANSSQLHTLEGEHIGSSPLTASWIFADAHAVAIQNSSARTAALQMNESLAEAEARPATRAPIPMVHALLMKAAEATNASAQATNASARDARVRSNATSSLSLLAINSQLHTEVKVQKLDVNGHEAVGNDEVDDIVANVINRHDPEAAPRPHHDALRRLMLAAANAKTPAANKAQASSLLQLATNPGIGKALHVTETIEPMPPPPLRAKAVRKPVEDNEVDDIVANVLAGGHTVRDLSLRRPEV
eukprot:gnl/TRDRNA2_/TRDRNA2_68486_c0_seq1.p1 gnl/TRDRNA2_/TRDRNA2_68486_c0~~gnl/TRDRNA2_/TRDRNA2_68486_c0_seq1.p1  ORF type:complete len:986 (+),score=160.39 gnl/TRDRNA2_/TRDRNA2_68486_c0_seq1:101-3058(+)